MYNLSVIQIARLNQEINQLYQTMSGVQASVDERETTIEGLRKELTEFQQRVAQSESEFQIIREEYERLQKVGLV